MRMRRVLGIAREGWPVVGMVAACAAVAAAAAAMLVGGPPAWAVFAAGSALTAWSMWFFRDPERVPPDDPAVIVSGADGVVCHIGPGSPPGESGLVGDEARRMMRVSVFMNVFDVHVNRAPAAGTVERIVYQPGKFLNASFDKASEANERLSLVLRMDDARALVVVQIAGLIARRIVCCAKVGDRLGMGERFGLIRFGSRVDHYVPAGSEVVARAGDRVRAGETVIARLRSGD